MRFIGNKEKIVNRIYEITTNYNFKNGSFFDFFSGTSNVGKFYKRKGFQIYSSDILYFSFVLQQAYLVNNDLPKFDKVINEIQISNNLLFPSKLDLVIQYLNNLDPVEGFIYNNYTPTGTLKLNVPRMFFTDENGKIIDAIRLKIEYWKLKGLLTDSEYYILIACLIESVPFYANISGVYAAFHKKWDPRALKKLTLKPIEIIKSNYQNYAFNVNSLDLIDDFGVDILYLDPPYNQRQYAPNYHLLETIARYDNPIISGVAGLRDYKNQKSKFCNAKEGIIELENIIKKANYQILLLSYNSEGIMQRDKILELFNRYGKTELIEFDYSRYKSHNNGENKNKKYIKEQIYVLHRNK